MAKKKKKKMQCCNNLIKTLNLVHIKKIKRKILKKKKKHSLQVCSDQCRAALSDTSLILDTILLLMQP